MKQRRIAIDARFYGPEGKGLGRYTERLISHLERLETKHNFVVLLRRENWDDYQPQGERWSKLLAPYRWYSVAEQLAMPALLMKHRFDLVHFAHFNIPVLYRGRFAVTIHDLILTQFPTERASTLGPFRYKLKHAASQFVLRRAVSQAAGIITVSRYSADEIARHLHVPRSRIEVITEGCEPFDR